MTKFLHTPSTSEWKTSRHGKFFEQPLGIVLKEALIAVFGMIGLILLLTIYPFRARCYASLTYEN